MAYQPVSRELAHTQPSRTGVLLIHLGTPSAPEPGAIRRYLRPFLSDPRVVEVPRPIWWLILNLFILPLRPRKLVHPYQSVWSAEGSPLLAIGRRQRAGLAERLGLPVALAMTYGEPSLAQALDELEAQNVRRLLVWPLYPQYSATTTAAAYDGLFRELMRRRWVPEIRTLGQYHDDPGYIEALAASVRAHWAREGRGGHLLISFHSIPRRYLEQGDPYHCQCQKTARLLAAALGLGERDWTISFQSRLGNQPWLMPYTDQVVPQLAREGITRLDVICPGFSADCLETLEEVSLRYGEDFRAAGGQALRYIPALNDSPDHLEALSRLARLALQGLASESSAPEPERIAAVEPRLGCPVRHPR
ncbi:MAG TPA: ferrochelatase [Nevskiaceae bacterium]|nr:ferrochelatase [Nevskiaceae bacterium]